MGSLPNIVGPYRIVRLLGEGGMGSVYEAQQALLERRVALKILHPEYVRNQDAVARLFNEAKVLSRLQHSSIVQVSDFGYASDGTTYLVMEYLQGESLASRLRYLAGRRERLAPIAVLQFAWQVADAITLAHAQGIAHRDLKPQNLMLVADPVAPGGERVKVLDFGIAKLSRPDNWGSVKTDTQAVMGTPMYMSPEQCAGAGGVDAKTDIYSLGCVLYEMLGGRPPFVAEGAGQIIGMHLFQTPGPLAKLAPRIPPKVADLVHQLLTKDKARRPSMAEAADNIGRLLRHLSGGNVIVTSQPAIKMDSDATASIPSMQDASTLGKDIGQKPPSTLPWGLLLTVALVALLVGAVFGIIILSWR